MYVIAIVGSREWADEREVKARVRGAVIELYEQYDPDYQNLTIISGGARGVDTWAIEAAEQQGFGTRVYPADWNQYGKSAGYRRNAEMVRDADMVIAFWNGTSKGTKHSIDLALAQRKHVEVLFAD